MIINISELTPASSIRTSTYKHISLFFSAHQGYWNRRKIFQCDRCLKSYTMHKNLRRHQTIECGKEKKFKCRFCPQKYYYNSSLKIHVKSKHKYYYM